ncbi:MAG: hypothetical protein MJK10_04815 [Pseudomonadales bacterium]|nr:hypothetical protein [Pseudomonadales bacterium]NRA15023.1 hypothetical protein [Oceanospirillaceae bacterium]
MKKITAVGSLFNSRVFLSGAVLATTLLIAGCGISAPKINLDTFNYYTINPNTGDFCKAYDNKDLTSQCQSIIPVNFFSRETDIIENAYRQEITDQNRARGLISMMTRGENLDYQVTALENGSYRLEINQQTDTAWKVLERIKKLTYLKK